MDVLISGAGIAGPALAYWLSRFGFSPVVVEKSSGLRTGGQAVDFRGSVHMSVLADMGVLDAVRAAAVSLPDMVFRDVSGRVRARLPASFTGGDLEIPRGDLTSLLYSLTADSVPYVFGDSIASLVDDGAGVDVTFASGLSRRFAFVVGADGKNSGVRSLVFPSYRPKFQGYYYSLWSADGDDRDMVCAPGVVAAPGWLMFKSRLLDPAEFMDVAVARYGSLLPARVSEMLAASDFYYDAISQVRMPSVRSGRVVLVGDAGYGSTLGGMGTGLAVVSAYVLAGEMARGGDAFARYEALIGPYARGAQGNAAPYLAPGSRLALWWRDRVFSLLPKMPMFARTDLRAATDIELPSYSPVR